MILVEDLIHKLKKLDGNLPVLVASDEEGNEHHPLWSIEQESIATEDGYNFDLIHPDDIDGDDIYQQAIVLT